MKYLILIPTFKGHLQQVGIFLESFYRHCNDAEQIAIRLVVSKNELELFSELENQWTSKLDFGVTDLQKILLEEEKVQIDEDELLEEIGKFNFQAMKKIYGVKYFDCEITLVMDSEALVVKKCRFSSIFEDYMKDKFVIYSQHSDWDFQRSITTNCTKMLGMDFVDLWMFEYQYWFFEKSIVDELFEYVYQISGKTIFENFKINKPLFEFNLYCLFIFITGRSDYRFVNAEELLEKHLGENQFLVYKEKMKFYNSTLFEYFPWGMTNENMSGFRSIFQSLSMKFFKYDDRHQVSENIKSQVKFINDVNEIYVLPCRVVCNSFMVNGFSVEKNHSLINVRLATVVGIFRAVIKKFTN